MKSHALFKVFRSEIRLTPLVLVHIMRLTRRAKYFVLFFIYRVMISELIMSRWEDYLIVIFYRIGKLLLQHEVELV